MVVSWHFVAGEASVAWETDSRQLFWPIGKLSGYGWLGVELFFLISGFVICMSSWGRTAGQFAISRFTRLYPAYWVAVVLTTAVVTVLPTIKKPLETVEVLANLTMAQQLLHIPHVDWSYWTLAVELQFYLLFAIVVYKGVTYRRVVAFCLAWSLAAIVVAGIGNEELMMLFASNYAPYFIAGVAFFLIHRFGSTFLLWGIVAMSWVTALIRIKNDLWWNGSSYRLTAVIISVFFAVMALVALGAFNKITWRWLTVAGAMTYPLYLLHQYIGLALIRELHPYFPAWGLLGGLVASMMLVAWLMHRWLERPMARLLRRQLNRSLERMHEQGADAGVTAKAEPAPPASPPAQPEPVELIDHPVERVPTASR